MNTLLVVAGLAIARVGWERPALSLVIPSATLVNALAFHIVPTIVEKEVSPGLYTSLFLYLPFSSWALVGARRDGVRRTAILTGLIAGTIVAVSVVVVARVFTPTTGPRPARAHAIAWQCGAEVRRSVRTSRLT